MTRTAIQSIVFYLHWRLWLVILAVPAHVAFVLRGLGNSRVAVMPRLKLAWICIIIHLRVKCGHSPMEALDVVEEIIELPLDMPGVIVECGAYLGGSTAKLSHAAAIAGRELFVCDSFEGLPEVSLSDHIDNKPDFNKGEYLGRLDIVKNNVDKFGKLHCVKFVPGWYEESLTQLSGIPVACAFWDVDLQESFKTCIRSLWANLRPGSKVFLHDVDRAPVVEVFADSAWWMEEMGINPPNFVGAYCGLGRLSPLIGYVIKE